MVPHPAVTVGGMTCPSEVKQHVEEALGNDPRKALVAVRQLAVVDLPWLEERAVRLARADGYTWARLGRLLQKSRQAVRKRFGEIDGAPQPPPFRASSHDDLVIGSWSRARADVRRRQEFADLGPDDAVPW